MSEPESEPESAGSLPKSFAGSTFPAEARGAFREVGRISVRHIEIARMLAVSENLDPLTKMRIRLEALMACDPESRRRQKISDEEFREGIEIYGVVIAFLTKQDRDIGGHLANVVPFTPRVEEEITRAFHRWLPGTAISDINEWSKHGLTPETSIRLQALFVRQVMPFIMNVTSRLADAISLEEFESASGKINLVAGP